MNPEETERLHREAVSGRAMDDKEFLLTLRAYIEQMEEQWEYECGTYRPLKDLIANGQMPAVYAEVLRRLEAA